LSSVIATFAGLVHGPTGDSVFENGRQLRPKWVGTWQFSGAMFCDFAEKFPTGPEAARPMPVLASTVPK
jgi:hypothetical protein